MATRAPVHGVAAKAHIEAVLGATGSGKSSYVKALMTRANPRRLLIFDPEGEWGDFGTITTRLHDVLEGFKAAGKDGPIRCVFVPSPDPATAVKQFDAVCRIAFAAERLTFIVDELKSVTSPSRSPVGWGMLTGRGRKRGIIIYGLSQRPASIDKDFLGNCNYVRTGRLTYSEDQRAVARVLGVAESEIGALPDLGWIRRDMATGETKRGGEIGEISGAGAAVRGGRGDGERGRLGSAARVGRTGDVARPAAKTTRRLKA